MPAKRKNLPRYVPCLRWKQGEYQALMRLSAQTKATITPLIEVAEPGWDFENQCNLKTVDEHLAPVAGRILTKWGKRTAWVDLKLIPPGERMAKREHPVTWLFDELRKNRCDCIPVVGPDRDSGYRNAVRKVVSKDAKGACIRLPFQVAAKTTMPNEVHKLLSELRIDAGDCDLVLDLGAPGFKPISGITKLVLKILNNIPSLDKWRTLVVLSTSFPPSMAKIKRGTALLPRHEWELHLKLRKACKKNGIRIPCFGDYAISHPDVLKMDMRFVKPSATIRYTVKDNWLLLKGPNVRDHGFGQYKDMCKALSASVHFHGPSFSTGDDYIYRCAHQGGSTGNLSVWRWVGTNHHIEKVAADVANLP